MATEASERIRRCLNDSDRIEVVGPAIVRTRRGDYEITTGISLRFPADSEVWIKAEVPPK